MKIDIIIPNYNGADLLKKNLPQILEIFEDKKNTKIIIIDDASSEIEKEKLQEVLKKINSKKITFLSNKVNKGFASTVNKGAKNSDADFLILLNSDALPQKDFLLPSLERFEVNLNLFGVGFMDKSVEGEKIVQRGRGVAKWEKGFLRHQRGEVDSDTTFWISGGSCIIDRKKFDKIGGFDEIFNPFYWEDIDLSYRAQKAGFDLSFEKKSVVVHKHSEGAIKKYYSQNYVKKIAFRNELFFIWKNISDTGLMLSHTFYLFTYLITSLLKANFFVIQGFFLAFTKLPDIIAKRQEQKKQYKKSDRQILSKFS